MWLFIPGASTSSPSAPEEAGSTSDWSWHAQALAQSVWWRGKPSPSPTWSKRCAKVSWLQRLCGAIPEPSAAESGAASWMASLAESRASLIASPASDSEKRTSATSGARRGASSCNPAHGSSSSRMSAACSRRAVPSAYGETFADWASRLRLDSSQRQKLARAIGASGSSSLQWPTMRSGSGAVNTLPEVGGMVNGRIEAAVANWPTPTANDWKGSGPTLQRVDGQMRGDRLDYATEQFWSTPRASDGEKGGPNQAFGAGGIPLPAQTAQWPTPTARDHFPPHSPEYIAAKRAEGHGMANLNDKVALWATPSASVSNDGETPSTWNARAALLRAKHGNGNGAGKPLTIQSQELLSSLPDPTTSADGEQSSPDRRSLNPLFVEWLMGWPPTWTMLASNASACSATALCRWKLLMQFALSQLGSPPPAPRPQLSFLL